MKDPFYAGILFAIESKILEGDQLAASQGLKLTDSNARSLIIKASKAAQGKHPQPVPDTASSKDKALGKLLEELLTLRSSLATEEKLADGTVEREDLTVDDWLASLAAVKESCSLHSSAEPGSRDYLDFLDAFLAQAGAEK